MPHHARFAEHSSSLKFYHRSEWAFLAQHPPAPCHLRRRFKIAPPIDTNWEGKADACIEALKTHDFVYLHVEGIDEVSHEMNLEKKLQGIEINLKRFVIFY